jgi:hypothetical protein
VQGELCDLVDLITSLEQATGRLMPQVMKSEVDDPEHATGAPESLSDASRVVGKDQLTGTLRLPLNDGPRFKRVLEAAVVTLFLGRMLCIPYEARAQCLIVVSLPQTSDLRLAPRRLDGEIQDVVHRDLGTAISMRKELAKPHELVRGGAPFSPP